MERVGLPLGFAALAATLLCASSASAQGAQLVPLPGPIAAPAQDAAVVPVEAAPAVLPAAEPVADILTYKEDKGSRMTVPVNVSGSGPYRFLVDTGAERTVISKELAARLDLDAGGDVKIHSMTEAVMVGTAVIPSLQISKSSFSNIYAPAFPAAFLGAAGMLGVDSLKTQRVVFDFTRKTMSIQPSEKRRENWGPDVIVVTGRSLYGRLVLVDATLEGEKIIVVVDTGSEVTIGNNALRHRLEHKKKLRDTVPVELVSVTGGRTSVDYTSVRKIAIGGVNISNMPIGFADVHPFVQLHLLQRPAILLGMDALRLFNRVSVDFARKEVRFLMPEDAGQFDRIVSIHS